MFIEPLKEKSHDSNKIATDKAEDFFSLSNRITLIGSAGSGKSTLIKYLLVKCIEEKIKVPIRVELRYLNNYDSDLKNYINKEVFQFQKLGVSDNKVDELLSNNYFTFFFDGFDEVSSIKRAIVANDIDMFTKRYPNNNYVVTSRPYADIELLPLFNNYSVSTLTIEEIETFVKKQISPEESELADKIINAINATENLKYRSFLGNPLLLSMFILTFQSYSEVPKKRSDFYQQVFDTLFSTHDSMSKMAYVREKQSGLLKQQFETVLSLFSFLSFFRNQFTFSSKYFNQELNYIKEKNINLTFDNQLLISDFQVAIGIINKEGTDYTFPHRSLQEYFAAMYIQQLSEEHKIRIYTSMAQEMLNDSYLVLSKSHLVSLLSELDSVNVIKYFTLPIIESTWNDVCKTNSNSEKVYYFNTAVISFLWTIESQKISETFELFFDYKSGIPIYFANKDEAQKKSVNWLDNKISPSEKFKIRFLKNANLYVE